LNGKLIRCALLVEGSINPRGLGTASQQKV